MYECKICDFSSSSRDEFLSHNTNIHDNSIQSENRLKSHESEQQPHVKIQELFLCSLCYEVYQSIDEVRNHMINNHDYVEDINYSNDPNNSNDGSEIESCNTNEHGTGMDIANDSMTPISLKELKIELKKNFTLRCSFIGCKYTFETGEKRLIHEKCHSSRENLRDFKCIDCQLDIKCWRNVSSHMWKQHKKDVDMLGCPYCSYKAVLSVQVFRHLQIHDNNRGFACSNCSKTFKHYAQLRCHSITHNEKKTISGGAPINTMRWYSQKTCDICGNIFANSKTRLKHIKSVHHKIKPFICNVCGHKSARKAAWQIHLRQHTGEKPLKCKYCMFKAADPSVIYKHELRHTKKPQYECPECKHKTSQTFAFKRHMKYYHPDLYKTLKCEQCTFISVNSKILERHIQEHKSGLIPVISNEDSNSNSFKGPKPYRNVRDIPVNSNVEISSDCFLPLESTDSIAHDPSLDTGGVTIPAGHSEETQFPAFL